MGVFDTINKKKKDTPSGATNQSTKTTQSGGLFNQIKSTEKSKEQEKTHAINVENNNRVAQKTDQNQQAQRDLATGNLGYEGLANNSTKIPSRITTAAAVTRANDAKLAQAKADLAAKQKQSVAEAPKAIRPIIKGLNKLGNKTKPLADVALELYTPGAPFSVIGGATKGAEALLAKYLPKLVNSEKILPKVATTAFKEAAVGVPLGVGNQLARNPESTKKELLEAAAYGGGGGALLGGAGSAAKGIFRQITQSGLRPAVENAINAPQAINQVAAETAPQSVRRVISKNAVPEMFPERFRRTVGGATKAPEDIIARTTTTPNAVTREAVEVPVSRGERANYGTQVREGNFGDEFNQAIANTDRTYPKQTNKEQIAEANRRVADLPMAESDFLSNRHVDGDHVATGYRLIQELTRLKQTVRAQNVAIKLAEDLTNSGQVQQAASIIKRLSPEGQLMRLQRLAKASGKEVAENDAAKFTELASDVQQGAASGADTEDFLNTINKIKAGQDVTTEELNHASRILDDAQKYVKSGKPQVERLPKEMKDVRTRDKVVEYLNSVEEAALARIKDRRGNLNSLPLGEWADHALVASAQIAKGTIKAGTYVEDLVRLFGEEVRPYAKAIYEEGKKILSSSSKNISQGKLNEANDIIERLRNSQTTAGKVAEKFIQTRDIKPGDVEKLRGLAKQINELRGKSAQEADIAMQEILNKYEKADLWDRVQALRYISMLLNTGTQLINAGSVPLMASANYLADITGGLVEIMLKTTRISNRPRVMKLYAANPLTFISEYMKNLGTGAKAGWKGVSPGGITGAGDIRGLTFKSKLNPLGILERTLNAVARGTDYAGYKTIADRELKKQAQLAAKGLRGEEKQQFIEKFLSNPPEEALEIADNVGKTGTFQRMDRLGGRAAQGVNNLPGFIKIPAKTIVPFIKTPVNIAEHAVDLTPVGLIRGIKTLLKKDASPAELRDAYQRMGLSAVGGGIGATGYYLNKIGVITGNNESGNVNVDKLKDSVGQGKYRLNTSGLARYLKSMLTGQGVKEAEKAAQYQDGDSQIDYNKFQPLAFPLAAGAAISEHRGEGIGAQANAAVQDAGSSLFSMSALRGIQDAFQAQAGSTGAEKVTAPINRIMENFVKSFSPSGLAQEANRRDDTVRVVAYNEGFKKDIKEYFMSRTPGQSQKLPAKVDAFGNEFKKPSGIVGAYVNPYKSQVSPNRDIAQTLSKLYDDTQDAGVVPKPLERSVEGVDPTTGDVVTKVVPKDDYNKVQKKIGDLQATMIAKIPDNLTPEQKAFFVKKIYEFTRKGANSVFKVQLGIAPDEE